MSSYDAVVLGAGHNGLVCAARLARAGRSVLVVERRENPGGTAATEEFAPGFRSSSCFPGAALLHPGVVDELDLERHGLELLRPRGSTYVPLPDGRHFAVPAPPPEIDGPERRLSEALARAEAAGDARPLTSADVGACISLSAFVARVAGALAPVMSEPLPELEPRGPIGAFDLLKVAWRLRRLGRDEMPEAMRLLPMCLQDVLDERLESDVLKASLAGRALTGSWLGPRSPGGALGLLHHHPGWSGGLLSPPIFVRGGPGRLCGAIADAAREAGGEIHTSREATRILVEDGRVTGVVVTGGDGNGTSDGGEEIRADVVVSALDPKTTLLELLDGGWLEPDVVSAVDDLRARGTVGIVRFALDRLPSFPGADGERAAELLSGRIQIGASLEELERAFDDVKYGRMPDRPFLEATIPTLTDPSLAPDDRHVMHVWVQHVPRTLRDGSWDGEAREALGDTVVELIEEHAPGFSEGILHRDVTTPADLEEELGLTGGCPYHAEMAMDQALYMRPIPGWYRYRMPVEGLYMCGAGTHPGGGVTGLPGGNAAARILADDRDGPNR